MLWWKLASVGNGGNWDGVQALGNLCFVYIGEEKWTMCGGDGITQSLRPGLKDSTQALCTQPMYCLVCCVIMLEA